MPAWKEVDEAADQTLDLPPTNANELNAVTPAKEFTTVQFTGLKVSNLALDLTQNL